MNSRAPIFIALLLVVSSLMVRAQESNAVEAIINAASRVPAIRLGDIVAAVTTPEFGPDQARLRILRCFKYGLLERAEKS